MTFHTLTLMRAAQTVIWMTLEYRTMNLIGWQDSNHACVDEASEFCKWQYLRTCKGAMQSS